MKDLFGHCTNELSKKRLFLFDMDGTIYNEDYVFKGTIPLLQRILELGGDYLFITNNSSKSVNDYVEKLSILGIPAEAKNFFTSSQATILYLKEFYAGEPVYVVGTRSLKTELEREQIPVVSPEQAKVLLIGFDTELTYEKYYAAAKLLCTSSLPYIATNPDLRCPAVFGYIPDCGAICKVLSLVTGKEPIYIGKPSKTMVTFAMKQLGYKKEETVVIGDRLYTDIACGVNAGVTTICVLTGEATTEEIKCSETPPTFVLNDVYDLYQILKN